MSLGTSEAGPGLYRIDVTCGPGGGVKILNQPTPPAFRESVRVGEQNLYTRSKELVGDRNPREEEFSIQMLEAQRYPDDFDGIISGAPALDYTGLVATHFAWLVQANTGPDGKDILTKDKVPLIRDAVAKQRGDATGLVTDPAACTFKPASLICKPGQNSECLSAAEAEVLEKWYAGPRNSRGEQLYLGGLPKGFGTLLACVADGASTDVPRIGTRWRPEFVVAIGRCNGQFVMVLDIDEVFAAAGEVHLMEES